MNIKPAEMISQKRNEAKKEIERVLVNFTEETGVYVKNVHLRRTIDAFGVIDYEVILEVEI
jgi:hypothetical protein